MGSGGANRIVRIRLDVMRNLRHFSRVAMAVEASTNLLPPTSSSVDPLGRVDSRFVDVCRY
jgi:hypothetical protein